MNMSEEYDEQDKTKVSNQTTTTFLDTGETATVTPFNSEPIPRRFFQEHQDPERATVHRFLAKPIELLTGSFSSADTSLNMPIPLNLPYDLINNNVYWPKLKGYYGFRCTMVFTLQVNAQRFQQGRYMLCYIPVGDTRNTAVRDQWYRSHVATTTSRTQLTRVEMDINKETSVQLKIPFDSSADMYCLQRDADWGVLKLFPYVALRSGSGALTAKYTLWGHMEDVELIGQALPLERQSNSLVEAKSKGVGPLESMATKISLAASVAGKIPLLTSYVAPVKWVADIVGNVANVFGWSAPANVDKQYRMEHSIMTYASNLNKVDKVQPMSLMLDNQVAVLPGATADAADELHFVHLATRFAYQDRFDWLDVNAEGSLLARYDVGLLPVAGTILNHTQAGVLMYDMTPAQWLSTHFAMWRGSVRFKFKIIKTEFHSGRLSFDFCPRAPNYTVPAMSDDSAPYLQRIIVDVREINEFIIEVPYIHKLPYCGSINMADTSFGNLEIRVIDPLVAPATVTSYVTVVMEHALGADAEFASHRDTLKQIYEDIEIQSNSMVIGDMKSREAQLETSKYCIGEKIISMRSMLKRYYPLEIDAISFTVANFIAPSNYAHVHSIIPFGICRQIVDDVYCTLPDLYSELGTIFLYSRGGVRFKMISDEAPALVAGLEVVQPPTETTMAVLNSGYFTAKYVRNMARPVYGLAAAIQPVPNLTYDTLNSARLQYAYVKNDQDKVLEIQVPQYNRRHSRNNAAMQAGTPGIVSDQEEETDKQFVQVYRPNLSDRRLTSSPGFTLRVFRAAADDCNFSNFVSIPPMAIQFQSAVAYPL